MRRNDVKYEELSPMMQQYFAFKNKHKNYHGKNGKQCTTS